jgi:hypothetical protein
MRAGRRIDDLTEVVDFDRQILDGLVAPRRVLRQTPADHVT